MGTQHFHTHFPENTLVTQGVMRRIADEFPEHILFFMPFGSSLYGTRTESSDIDLIAVFMSSKVDFYLRREMEQHRRWYSMEGDLLPGEQPGASNKIEVQFLDFFSVINDLIRSELKAIEILSYLRASFSNHLSNTDTAYGSAICAMLSLAETMSAFDLERQAVSCTKVVSVREKSLETLKTYVVLQEWARSKMASGMDPGLNLTSHDGLKAEFLAFSNTLLGVGKDGSLFSKPILTKSRLQLREFNEHLSAKIRMMRGEEELTSSVNRGLSNAMRMICEIQSILLRGYITFPLKDADLIRDIKTQAIPREKAADLILNRYSVVRGYADNIENYQGKCAAARSDAFDFVEESLPLYIRLIYRHLTGRA